MSDSEDNGPEQDTGQNEVPEVPEDTGPNRDIIHHMIDDHDFFGGSAIEPSSLKNFIESFKLVDFQPGEVVCRQHEEGESVFVIETGEYDIYTTRRKADGVTLEEFLVATIGGGAEFGMMEYQYAQPRLGTVIVNGDSDNAQCWKAEGEDVAKFIQANPELKKNLHINRLLFKTLKETNLLNNIDEPNIIQKLIYTFREENVQPGDRIINQGDAVNDDSKLYVLFDGAADVFVEKPFVPTEQIDSLKTGDNFGDTSFLYDIPRPHSVVAQSACSLLTLKKNQFQELAAKGSSRLKAVFDEYAHHRSSFRSGSAEEFYMSAGQFADALKAIASENQSLNLEEWTEKLVLLTDLATLTSDGELIRFTEFLKRALLMTKPSPEVEIGFRLFDAKSTGTVDIKLFRKVMIEMLRPDECPFDLQAGVPGSVFGNVSSLDLEEFQEWFEGKDGSSLDWRSSEKIQTLTSDVKETFHRTYRRFRSLGLEDALNDDCLPTVRGSPSGVAHDIYPYLLSGISAAVISRTLVYPLTRAKIIAQVSNSNKLFTMPKIGWNLFAGNAANMWRTVPAIALQFSTFEYLNQQSRQVAGSSTTNVGTRWLNGCIAGVVGLTLTYPLDIVRTRMAVATAPQRVKNYSTLETLFNLKRSSGWMGFTKGYFPALCSVAPFVATQFVAYETLHSVFDPLTSGALAGAFAGSIVYPLEVIRRRMQAQGFSQGNYKYSSMANAFSTIMKQDGIMGFYRGIAPNLIRVAPATAISFAAYEAACPYWRDTFDDFRYEKNYHWPEEASEH